MTIKYRLARSFASLSIIALLTGCAGTGFGEKSNQSLIFGGTIYTADPSHRHAEAVGVENGVIVAVGSYAAVKDQLDPGAEQIDLEGAYLMPGLIDTHVHTAFAGFQEQTVNFPEGLKEAGEIHDFLASVQEDSRLRIGDVIYLSNVNIEEYWNQLPLLDRTFNHPQYEGAPVVLAGYDAHTGWANHAMLKKAGINPASAGQLDPSVKDNFGINPDGQLNGYVSEGAWDLILAALPPVEDKVVADSIRTGAKALNQFGITAWMDPISNILPAAPIFSAHPDRSDTGLLPVYAELSRQGELPGHVSALALVGINSAPAIIEDVLSLKERFSNTPDVKLVGIKILQDGVIESPSDSAKLSKPYLNQAGYTGKTDLDQHQYRQMLATADRNGLLIHIHAIGDRAVTEALDGLQYVRTTNGNDDLLHSLTHLQLVNERDIPRLKELNVGASMQLLWATGGWELLLQKTVPGDLLSRMYPAGSLHRNDTLLAGASDWPVSTPNPFLAMYVGMTRTGPDGAVLPPPDEAVDRQTLLQAYTINAARLIGRDQEIGSIEVGKSADFAVLDRNLEDVDVEAFRDTQVLWTMFKGRVVYRR